MTVKKAGLTIGGDLGGTRLKYGLFDGDGETLMEKNVASEADRGADHVIRRMTGLFRELIDGSGRVQQVRGIGLGVAGLIDGWRGIVRTAPNLPGWRDIQVKATMEAQLRIPVIMDNDANVAALAEFHFGAGRGVDSMMMITLGTGVGGGLILDGEIYRGTGGLAGEFGHTVVDLDGPPCHCGNRGCIESYVGNYAILRRFFEKMDAGERSSLSGMVRESVSVETISLAGEKGDQAARATFKEAGEALGVGMANVVNLLNIQRFVVGGGVAEAGELILAPAREALYRTAFKDSAKIVDVVAGVLGDRAGMVGAARMAKMSL